MSLPINLTKIGVGAFTSCENLVSIEIPEKVVSIGEEAFRKCWGLTSINIPAEVTTIENYVFCGCGGLTSIKIPEEVTSIGDHAFDYCSGLTSVSLPDKVTSIGNYAFNECSKLETINIPNGVISIGEWAFGWCSKLKSIVIPNGVTAIEGETFCQCNSLESVQLPESVTSIGEAAFYQCNSLKSLDIPEGVTELGYRAIGNCGSLKSIKIPVSMAKLGEAALSTYSDLTINIKDIESWMNIEFDSRWNNEWGSPTKYSLILNGLELKDLVVPSTIDVVKNYSFKDCASIESIIFHKDVSVITKYAFSGCTNVNEIVCQGDTPPACGAKALEGISRTACTLYVPETSGSNYKNTDPWSEFTNIVGGGTDTPDTPKTCEAPTITFDNDAKKLVLTSATEGATFHCTITSDDMMSDKTIDGEATMAGIYNITVYASADGMYNSEKTTAKLCWVSAEVESDGIMSAKSDRGVIVSSNGNQIDISGTTSGETINVYDIGGSLVKSIKADYDNTTITGLQSGSVYILKIGGTKVKVAM